MKKSLLLCGLLLALTASIASAAGVNLRWTNCFGDAGLTNRTSACASSIGNAGILVGSFVLGADQLGTSGVEIVLDVATAGATLPAWWLAAGVGPCRAGLTMNSTISATATNCFDWASGGAAGGLAAYNQGTAIIGGLNTARGIGGFAVAASGIADLPANTEFFAFNAVLSNVKTTGTGACAGCQTAACIVLNSIKVATPPVVGQPSRDVVLSGPSNGTDSNYVTWQGGAGVSSLRGNGCPAATPTRNATWSSVKSLYR